MQRKVPLPSLKVSGLELLTKPGERVVPGSGRPDFAVPVTGVVVEGVDHTGVHLELMHHLRGFQRILRRRHATGDPQVQFGVDTKDRRRDIRDSVQVRSGP